MGKEKLWTRSYITVIVMGTLMSLCFYMIMPVIGKYATFLGADVAAAGMIAGLFSVTALAVRPFCGYFADRLNRKKMLMAAILTMAIAAAGYSFSSSIPLLFVFRVLHGAGFAAASTTSISILGTIIPRSRMGEGIGYYGVTQILATALGPGIGMSLSENCGYRVSFLVSAAAFVLAAGVSMLIPLEENKKSAVASRIPRPADLIAVRVIPFALFGMLFSACEGIIGTYLVLLADERSIGRISLYYAAVAVSLFLIRPVAGKLSDRKGIAATVVPAYVSVGIGLIVISVAGSLAPVIIAAVLIAMGQGAGNPGLQSECLKVMPEDCSGIAASTYYIGLDIGQGFGPMAAGLIVRGSSYGNMYRTFGILMMICGCLFLLYCLRSAGLRMPETVRKAEEHI